MADQFAYPYVVDLAATFLFAWSGALLASRRGYDPIGVFIIALVSGLGGGLIRDGLFLQQGPPAALRDSRLLLAVLVGCLGGVVKPRSFRGAAIVFEAVDAVGLGLYAIVGASAALSLGLQPLPAVVVGVTNAVGGGILRDVLTREEPLLLKPGHFYAAAALAGCATYVWLRTEQQWLARPAASVAVGVTLLMRGLAIRFDLKTRAVRELWPQTEAGEQPHLPQMTQMTQMTKKEEES